MTWRRLGLILALRLGALLVAFLMILRPSLAFEEEAVAVPSKLLVLADYSESMSITDEFDGLSRWDNVKRILLAPSVTAAFRKLANEHRVELVYYQAAEDLRKLDLESQATGKRTDMGVWLHELWQRHGRDANLRGILIFSDGADNGTRFPTLDRAAAWRRDYRGACPIDTWGTGRPTTTRNQSDIYFDEEKIFTDPVPVPVKGKLTVKGFAHAPGMEGVAVTASLWLEGPDGKPQLAAPKKRVELKGPRDNEVTITCEAPITPGEYKATLKIDPVQGEITEQNNAITTYVTVTKEGVSVLWVEGRKRAFESAFAMRYALGRDPQFRVYYAEKLKEKNPKAEQEDWFDFDKRHYDVIVIGDISASRFAGNHVGVFDKLRKMIVTDGSGLLMLGGYETFGESDWHQFPATKLTELLPVLPTPKAGQIEQPIKFTPTDAGLRYMLRIDKDEESSRLLWEKMPPLEGMSRVGKPLLDQPGVVVHATAEGKEPILVSRDVGKGRTLVFGGDTTWRAWRRSEEGLRVHQRFWTQLILWLAHRDDAEGDIRITLDRRRLPAGQGSPLEINVSLRGKGGNRVENAKVVLKVIGPNKEEYEVPVTPRGNDFQAVFSKTYLAGEYQVVAIAEGKDVKGNPIGGPDKPARVRFLTYSQDVENLRTAADHEFLAKLARAGGGKFHLADEQKLVQFLESLSAQQQAQAKGKPQLWPDWHKNPASDAVSDQLATLWGSTALGCFLVFTTLLCVEWFLRRRWGMV